MNGKATARNATKKCVFFPELDAAKLFMAFLVLEIHVKPFASLGSGTVNRVMSAVDSVAVPFFFIASAFLCFRDIDSGALTHRDSNEAMRVRKTVAKLLRLYVIWFVLYIPFDLFVAQLHETPLAKFVLFEVRGFLLVGEGFISWPLWYLLASVIGFILVYVMLRGGVRPSLILAVSVLAMLFGFAIQTLHGWDGAPSALAIAIDCYFKLFANVRNGLFEGFFYIALGMCLGARWEAAVKIGIGTSSIIAFGGLMGCLFVSSDAHLPFCAAYALGVFLLSIHRNGEDAPSHSWVRNASTIVYLVHMMFIVVVFNGLLGYEVPYEIAGEFPHEAVYGMALAGSLLASAVVIPLAKRAPLLKSMFGI